MKLVEIIKAARVADPEAFGSTDDERAMKILRAGLRQVRRQLMSAKEGAVVVGGLGRFSIKAVEHERNGTKVTRRRVTFRHGGAGKSRRAGARKVQPK